jgi:hypothetical protein
MGFSNTYGEVSLRSSSAANGWPTPHLSRVCRYFLMYFKIQLALKNTLLL